MFSCPFVNLFKLDSVVMFKSTTYWSCWLGSSGLCNPQKVIFPISTLNELLWGKKRATSFLAFVCDSCSLCFLFMPDVATYIGICGEDIDIFKCWLEKISLTVHCTLYPCNVVLWWKYCIGPCQIQVLVPTGPWNPLGNLVPVIYSHYDFLKGLFGE